MLDSASCRQAGNAAFSQGKYADAEACYSSALARLEEEGNTTDVHFTYSNRCAQWLADDGGVRPLSLASRDVRGGQTEPL